MSHQHIESKDN